MAYLFDTDALSELLRQRPSPRYIDWLQGIPPDEQFASAISVAELYQGALQAQRPEVVEGIERLVLPKVIILPFSLGIAKLYGSLRATMKLAGTHPGDADVQIAATAIHHGLEFVTGNLRHHQRIPGLAINRTFAETREPRT